VFTRLRLGAEFEFLSLGSVLYLSLDAAWVLLQSNHNLACAFFEVQHRGVVFGSEQTLRLELHLDWFFFKHTVGLCACTERLGGQRVREVLLVLVNV